jgi:hypothetical protein
MPVGQANQVGKTADVLALWAVRVKGADVPGRFVIIDGAFIEVEPSTFLPDNHSRSQETLRKKDPRPNL